MKEYLDELIKVKTQNKKITDEKMDISEFYSLDDFKEEISKQFQILNEANTGSVLVLKVGKDDYVTLEIQNDKIKIEFLTHKSVKKPSH